MCRTIHDKFHFYPILFVLLLSGCVVDEEDNEIDNSGGKADFFQAREECENAFVQREHEDVLEIEAPWEFDFCPEAQGLNRLNLHWMAYFAANAYSHPGYVLPQLDMLRFGSTTHVEHRLDGVQWDGRESEYLYDCVDSLYWFQCTEERVELSSLWEAAQDWPNTCAHEWYQNTEGQPPSLTAAFEEWFVQNQHSSWSIQFFSGGEFTSGFLDFHENSTHMLWAEHRELPLIVVAFRGTELDSLSDLLVDTELFQRDFGNWGEVHSGFLGAFDSLFDERIEARLQYVADHNSEANIWITGHSLGGALATLMAATILERKERDPSWRSLKLRGLVTFGSPHVGDGDFVLNFNRLINTWNVNSLRVVHGDDIITRLPIDRPYFGLGYEHVGTMVYLGKENDPNCCPADDPSCCSGDEGSICPWSCILYSPEEVYIHSSQADHSIHAYYDRIRASFGYMEENRIIYCSDGE